MHLVFMGEHFKGDQDCIGILDETCWILAKTQIVNNSVKFPTMVHIFLRKYVLTR